MTTPLRFRPIYAAIGVSVSGEKDILGLWAGTGGEGAKFWMSVLTEIRNRGVKDVFFLVCDGLKGLPDVVGNVWPLATVQTCIIHLIRNTFRLAGRQHWESLKRDVKPIYTAINADAARVALDELSERWGAKYGAIVRLWNNAWEEFVPFLDYDVEIRRVICSTNAIVICSASEGVFDVEHVLLNRSVLRAGCGYLPRSRRQISGRRSACYAGGFAGLVA